MGITERSQNGGLLVRNSRISRKDFYLFFFQDGDI